VDAFQSLLHEALIVTAILTLPILGLATLVGLAVAILQAATQVQEQTLSLLPKILVVGTVVALGGGFGIRLCASLMLDAVAQIPNLVRGG
jgi:flagellar biosynthetic protein FliQ